jgi:hypothetical protein
MVALSRRFNSRGRAHQMVLSNGQEHQSVRAILPVFWCEHNRNTYLCCTLTAKAG